MKSNGHRVFEERESIEMGENGELGIKSPDSIKPKVESIKLIVETEIVK